MSINRDAFRIGIENLLQLQRHLGHRPKNSSIPKFVHKLVKEADLRDDPRRRYYELLATCALLGLESMYANFKPRRKHGNKEKSCS
jgi:hypothetical protein